MNLLYVYLLGVDARENHQFILCSAEECRCIAECWVDTPLFTRWSSCIIYRVSPPSLTIMDMGVCLYNERARGLPLEDPRLPPAANKDSPIQFGACLVPAKAYQRYEDKSWVQTDGLRWNTSHKRIYLLEGWWRNQAQGCPMWIVHRSLPLPVAPGLVVLKEGRLKGLIGAGLMLCEVI